MINLSTHELPCLIILFMSIHGRCRLTLVTQWPHAAASVAASWPSGVGSMVPYEGEEKETAGADIV